MNTFETPDIQVTPVILASTVALSNTLGFVPAGIPDIGLEDTLKIADIG